MTGRRSHAPNSCAAAGRPGPNRVFIRISCQPGLYPAGAVARHSGDPDCDDRGAPAMNGRTPSRRCAEEGAAAVEAGLVMSVLLLLIIGSVEFGRAFWTYNTMLLAVEEAGRYAMVYKHGPPGSAGLRARP